MESLDGVSEPKIQLAYGMNERSKKLLSVTDNGQGMSSEIQEQIFVPFFTSKDSGTGIGLSLSKRIIQQHNGTIKVHSVPRKETVFLLEF